MAKRAKVWTAMGVSLLAGATVSQAAMFKPAAGLTLPLVLAEGEGGEGGEGGAAVVAPEGDLATSYALNSTDASAFAYDGKAQINAYAKLAYGSTERAADSAKDMERAIEALLRKPSEKSLTAARNAWLKARQAWLRTEAFRFYGGPVDAVVERINAWPIDGAAIDQVVAGDSKLDLKLLEAAHGKEDDKSILLGWHVVEYLLWGQDPGAGTAGNRPYTEFSKGQASNDRRRKYVELAAEKLVADLLALEAAWAPGRKSNYRAKFVRLPQREALGRMFNGLIGLAHHEMAHEQLEEALDSKGDAHEQSRFSDASKADLVGNLESLKAVWSKAGLDKLLNEQDKALADAVAQKLADAEVRLAALDEPFDGPLFATAPSPGREKAEAAERALAELAEALKKSANKLGLLVVQ